jgi:multimeric flavodoxin WrbA
VDGIEGILINVDSSDDYWDSFKTSSAIIFGSPTYFGSISGRFKSFMDRSGPVWADQSWRDKLAAGFTCSDNASGDKLQALIQLSLFAAQHGMHWINPGVGPGDVSLPRDSNNPNRLGSWLGAMAQSQRGGGGPMLFDDDAETARLLGTRVAQIVKYGLPGSPNPVPLA